MIRLLIIFLLLGTNAVLPAVSTNVPGQLSQLPALRSQPAYGLGKVGIKMGGQVDTSSTCKVGINDYIYLEAINYNDWMATQSGKDEKDLVLYLEGEPLPGLHPKFFGTEWEEAKFDNVSNQFHTNRISCYGVRLQVNEGNRDVWKKLLRSRGFELERPMEVSLGFVGSAPMYSWVYPLPDADRARSPFFLVVINRANLILWATVLIGAFLLFLPLARKTEILRDPNLPLRPDGKMPFSLARFQMAFWFFLVIGSYFFLWLLFHDTDTLNASIITLIGISAGTAVGSAIVDAGKRTQRDLHENVVDKKDLEKPREALLTELQSELSKTEENLQKTRAAFKDTDTTIRAKEMATAKWENKRRVLEYQIEFFQSKPWQIAVQDLLGENGVVSFHRFQMCIWTLVLGIIFVHDVYSDMAMPEFSATLLGLMGLSAGTFIAFKIPSQPKP